MDTKPDGAPFPAMPPSQTILLVVEDEPCLLEVASMALEEAGYMTVSASSGDAALAELSRNPGISLIFTDIMMPGILDGVQMACEARRIRPGIPVVFASGYSRYTHGGSLPDNSHFIQKPYRFADLMGEIRSSLEAAPPAAMAPA